MYKPEIKLSDLCTQVKYYLKRKSFIPECLKTIRLPKTELERKKWKCFDRDIFQKFEFEWCFNAFCQSVKE